MPALLKPAARALASLLWALKLDTVDMSALSGAQHLAGSGRTSFAVDKALDRDAYRVLGYKQCGERAVRVDILERLADLIRPALSWRAGSIGEKPAGAFDGRSFVVTQAMTSLTGSAGEDFASVLRALGYRMEKRPPLPPAVPAPVEAAPAEAAAVEAVAAEAGAETALAETPVEASAAPQVLMSGAIAEPAATVDTTTPAAESADDGRAWRHAASSDEFGATEPEADRRRTTAESEAPHDAAAARSSGGEASLRKPAQADANVCRKPRLLLPLLPSWSRSGGPVAGRTNAGRATIATAHRHQDRKSARKRARSRLPPKAKQARAPSANGMDAQMNVKARAQQGFQKTAQRCAG